MEVTSKLELQSVCYKKYTLVKKALIHNKYSLKHETQWRTKLLVAFFTNGKKRNSCNRMLLVLYFP